MKTTTVRIPMCIAADGRWHAVGWGPQGGLLPRESEMVDAAIDSLDNDPASNPEHVVWITAEVPVPDPRATWEVQGAVEPESEGTA